MRLDEYDQPSWAYCQECGKECRPQKVDYGVGRIEVRGHIFYHHDWRWISPCCDAAVGDCPPEEKDDESD